MLFCLFTLKSFATLIIPVVLINQHYFQKYPVMGNWVHHTDFISQEREHLPALLGKNHLGLQSVKLEAQEMVA